MPSSLGKLPLKSTPKPLLVAVSHTNTTWRRVTFEVDPPSSFRSKLVSTQGAENVRLRSTSNNTYELQEKFTKKLAGSFTFALVHVDECRHAKISKTRCNGESFYPNQLSREVSVDFVVLPEKNWKCVATSTVSDLPLFDGDTREDQLGKGFVDLLNTFFKNQANCK